MLEGKSLNKKWRDNILDWSSVANWSSVIQPPKIVKYGEE